MIDTIKTKSAFTLAEVLITLVVIGVVAALTIPTLIAKYQKEQTVAQLKQVFSQLSQAVRLSVTKYGDVSTWDFSSSAYDFFNRYLKNNFVKAQEITVNSDEISYQKSSGGLENDTSESGLLAIRNGAKALVLNSGAIIYSGSQVSPFSNIRKRCFVVDLNGLKKPNKFGRDAFFLCVDGESGNVVPHMSNDSEPAVVERTREQLKNGGTANGMSYHCNNTTGRGMWCAALIIRDGWQIKDDYPW